MLRLGTHREIITPPDVNGLTPDGMPRTEAACGVLDDLWLNLFVLETSERIAVIAVADQLFATEAAHDELEKILHDRLPGAALIFCVTHNHSASPVPFGNATEAALARCQSAGDLVREAFARALSAALAKMCEVEVAGARVPFPDPPGLNRRVKLSNGSAVSAFGSGPVLPPGWKCAGEAGGDARSIDVLAFRPPGSAAPCALLTAYSSHIHFYEIPYFTGEAAGAASLALRGLFPEMHPMYAVSFAGDVALKFAQPIPCDDAPGKIQWQQESAERFGRAFATAVAGGLTGLRYEATDVLRFQAHAESGEKTGELLAVETLRIGKHAIACLPGEMFQEWEDRLRETNPAASLLVMGYNRSWLGYVATPLAFEEGSYETMRGPADVLGYHTPDARVKSSTQTGARILEFANYQLNQLFRS